VIPAPRRSGEVRHRIALKAKLAFEVRSNPVQRGTGGEAPQVCKAEPGVSEKSEEPPCLSWSPARAVFDPRKHPAPAPKGARGSALVWTPGGRVASGAFWLVPFSILPAKWTLAKDRQHTKTQFLLRARLMLQCTQLINHKTTIYVLKWP
jgi:hypothetical protein